MIADPEFTLGIEEEYFLVDKTTRNVVDDPPDGMLAEFEALLGAQVSPEFLRSQIEIGTRVCASLEEARAEWERAVRAFFAEKQVDLGGKVLEQYLEQLHLAVRLREREGEALRERLRSVLGTA